MERFMEMIKDLTYEQKVKLSRFFELTEQIENLARNEDQFTAEEYDEIWNMILLDFIEEFVKNK
jgi:hypothetical protein